MENQVEEIWKNVTIEPFTCYMISNLGNIKGKYGLIKLTKTFNGYLKVSLNKKKYNKSFTIHRLVAITFLDKSDNNEKLIVNHKDSNKTNNNVNNLEWITYSENTIHYINSEYYKQGGRPILITYDNILKEYSCIEEIVRRFGISKNTVRKYCRDQKNTLFNYKSEINDIEIIESINNIKDNEQEYIISKDRVVYKYYNNNQIYDLEKINGFEDYLITKCGIIFSLLSAYKSKLIHLRKMTHNFSGAYYTIKLRKNNISNAKLIHRLVLSTFLSCKNMEKLLVNHKNLNKLDNRVENLEWCTNKENIQHAHDNLIICKKPVVKYDLNMNKLKEYKSIKNASYDTFNSNRCSDIIRVCKGKRKNIGNYIFRYLKDVEEIDISYKEEIDISYKEEINISDEENIDEEIEYENKIITDVSDKDIKIIIDEYIKKFNEENITKKLIFKYDNNFNFIKEYLGVKSISLELYKDDSTKYLNRIYNACNYNNNVNDTKYKLVEGFIFKYKEIKKYIYKYDLECNFLFKFNNIRNAAIDLFGKNNNKNKERLLRGVCLGRAKSTHGYVYKYVIEE